MKKMIFLSVCILLMAASFWIGTISDRYLYGVERENQYPFKLRDVWVNNQPTCDDYAALSKGHKSILIDTVKDDANQLYVKIASLPLKNEENRIVYSILNRDQEQYIDELWMDCK